MSAAPEKGPGGDPGGQGEAAKAIAPRPVRRVDLVSLTIFHRTPDGRTLFRPLGSVGPCYAVTEAQRRIRASVQLGYYALLVAFIASGFFNTDDLRRLALQVGAYVAGNYLLYAIFTIGLERIPAPPAPGRELARAMRAERLSAIGRPRIKRSLYSCLALSLIGLAGAIVGPDRLGLLLASALFGAGVLVFLWMLKILDDSRTQMGAHDE